MKSWWCQVASWSLRDANIFTQSIEQPLISLDLKYFMTQIKLRYLNSFSSLSRLCSHRTVPPTLFLYTQIPSRCRRRGLICPPPPLQLPPPVLPNLLKHFCPHNCVNSNNNNSNIKSRDHLPSFSRTISLFEPLDSHVRSTSIVVIEIFNGLSSWYMTG